MSLKTATKKQEREKETIQQMIVLYCHGHKHERKEELCEKCAALLNYASARVDHCPFMEEKTFCSNCTVHCYKADRREEIREVMRYAGPRMMWHSPVKALQHLLATRKEKKKQNKEESFDEKA